MDGRNGRCDRGVLVVETDIVNCQVSVLCLILLCIRALCDSVSDRHARRPEPNLNCGSDDGRRYQDLFN